MARPKDACTRPATESSPLISNRDEQPQNFTGRLTAANGQPPTTSNNDSDDDGEAESDGERLERQTSLEDRLKQHEGMPEVKAKLPYIIPALGIGIFLSAADQTIIVSSYGKIGSEMQSLQLVSWIATAYFLTLTSFQPLYGKLSDIFGRKPCLLVGYAIFGVGSVACGLAQNMEQLIAARAFAGIGGGGMTTVVSIMLSDIVPLRERGKWQGYLNIIFATGSSAGAPLGGIFADMIGWRWAFILQGPLCLAAFLSVLYVLHLPETDDSHWKKKLRRIDFLGAAILVAAVFTLLLALDRGSNVSWRSAITLASLGSSIPLFIIFVLVEVRVANEPFAPGHIVFSRAMVASYLCNFFSFAGAISALFYAPLYFQAVDGLSATGAGLRLIPSIVAGVAGSLACGFYMQKTGKYYWLTVAAYMCLTVGMIIVTLSSGLLIHSPVLIIIGLCFNGLGNGTGVTSSLIALIANATHEDQAIATACSYLFRSLGSVFGVSISATAANQALRSSLASELPRLGLPESEALEIAGKVRESLEYLRQLEPSVREIVVDCYARSTRAAFTLQICLVAGAAISALFIKEKALGK